MNAWFRCDVSAGQFDSEAAVHGKDYKGAEFSLFVPIGNVHPSLRSNLGQDWRPGEIQVEILDSRDKLYLIYLPAETFSNGQSITVSSDQIKPIKSPQAA